MSYHVAKRRKRDYDDVDAGQSHIINVLPPEVVLLICAHLSVEDKLSLRCVNKRMYSLLSSSLFWKEAVMDRYKRNNPLLVRTLLQLCSGSGSTLRYLQLPYYTSRNNISYVAGCKNLERLSWGGGVGFTAIGIQNLLFLGNMCNFPNLTHLEVKMKSGVPFPFDCISKMPSLQHLVINDDDSDAFGQISSSWIANNCIPPMVTLVTRKIFFSPIDLDSRLPQNTDIRFSVYHGHKRPLNLPYYDLPMHSSCGGNVKTRIDQDENWPDWPWPALIEINYCAGPYIFSPQTRYSYVKLLDPYGTEVQDDQLANFKPFSKYILENDTLVSTLLNAPIDSWITERVLLYHKWFNLAELQIKTIDNIELLPQCCPNLINLRIESFNESAENYSVFWIVLAEMESLQLLTIPDCYLPEAQSPVPPNIVALEVKEAWQYCCSSFRAESLVKFSSLRYLSIRKHIPHEDCLPLFEALSQLPQLVSLNINYTCHLPPATHLSRFYAQLESLQWYNRISHAALSRLSNLKQLFILGVSLTEEDIEEIVRLPKLDVLIVMESDQPLISYIQRSLNRQGVACLCGKELDMLPMLDTELDRLNAPNILDV